MSEKMTDQELHAFIDGELDRPRAEEIAAELAATPTLAQRAARFRRDKERLAEIYQPILDTPLPDRLVRAVMAGTQAPVVTTPAIRSWYRPAALAGLALAASLLLVVWLTLPHVSSGGGADPVVAEALAARDGTLHPADHVGEATLASAEARDGLAARTMDVPIKVPDLAKAGFTLAGIETYDEGSAGKSMQLSYRDASGRRFTILLHRPRGGDQFAVSRQNGLGICVWENEDLIAVMLAPMSTDEMLKAANLTYADLNL